MLKFKKFIDEGIELGESLRKDIARLSAKFPEGSKVRCKKSGKTGKVLTVGKDFVKVAVDGGKDVDYKPDELVSLKEEVEQIDELDSKTYRSYIDKATADQLKRTSKSKRSKKDQHIMRKRSLGISTASMKQYGDKRTMSQRIRREEVSEAAKNTKHPAHDALMDLAKELGGSDARPTQVAAGKLSNFTATGNRGVLSDLVKMLRSMDSYPRDAIMFTIKKFDKAMFKTLAAKM